MAAQRRLFQLFVRGLHAKAAKVETSPGGALKVLIKQSCTLNIRPLNPHEFDWDHVSVGLRAAESDGSTTGNELNRKELEDFDIVLKSEVLNGQPLVSLTDQAAVKIAPASELVVDVHLPGLFDVDVSLESGTVNVLGTIEGDVEIQSSAASVNIEKLKSTKIDVSTDAGSVSAGVLQGSVCIRSETGDISVGKVQGPRVVMQTTSGNIRTQAMYSEEIVLNSQRGCIELDGLKGNSTVSTTEGNVKVSAVQGSLFVESDSGSIVAQLSQPEDVCLETKSGDVSIGIPKELSASIDLQGEKNIDDEIVLNDVTECTATNSVAGLYVPDSTSSASNSLAQSARLSKIKARAPFGQLRLHLARWGPAWLR